MRLYLYFLSAVFSMQSLICMHNQHVIAIHEHELKPTANAQQYERDISAALEHIKIPGLLYACLLKGWKGTRQDKYAVLWIFENQQAIRDNFGTLDAPCWPEIWLQYENEILARYIIGDPDAINFTDYEIIA